MLLAEVATQIVRHSQSDRPIEEHSGRNFESARDKRWLFDGIERWPHLSRVFHQVAADLIAQTGVAGWIALGGARTANGSLGFGSRSPVASEILHRIAGQTGAFHFVDDRSGDEWAVLLAPDDRVRSAPWLGLAISGEFSPRLVSRRVREQALRVIDRHLDELNGPAILSVESADRGRVRLERWRCRLRLLDLGLRMLPSLCRFAAQNQTEHVSARVDVLAAAAWGPDDCCWPAEWQSLAFDAIASLCRIQVQILELPKSGWCPRTILRRPAIDRLAQVNLGSISVRFARPFLSFVGHWRDRTTDAAPFTVHNAAVPNLPLHRFRMLPHEYK